MATAHTLKRLMAATAITLITVVLLGCGARTPTDTPTDGLTDNGQQSGLPALDDLARVASYTPGRFRSGADVVEGFSIRTELPSCGLYHAATLSPVPEDGAYMEFDNVAYVVYGFTVPGYDDAPELHLHWQTPPVDTSLWYIGISDWESGGWHWLPGKILPDYTLESIDPYLDENGRIYVAVVAGGPSEMVLDRLYLGAQETSLTVTPTGYENPNLNSYQLEFEITLPDAPYIVELDSNFYENYIDGDPVGSFGMNPPASVQLVAGDVATAGPQSFPVVVEAFNSQSRVFAVRITDNNGDVQVVWNSTPQNLQFIPQLVLLEQHYLPGQASISISFPVVMQTPTYSVELCYDLVFAGGDTFEVAFDKAVGAGTVLPVASGLSSKGMYQLDDITFAPPGGEHCLAVRVTDSMLDQRVYLLDSPVYFE